MVQQSTSNMCIIFCLKLVLKYQRQYTANLLTSPCEEVSIRVCSSRAGADERLSSPGLESDVDGMDQIAACISAFKL